MYKDVPANRWDAGSIERVTQSGLMSGYPDGTFQPDKPLTRGEMASILDRWMFRDGIFSDILPSILPSVATVIAGNSLGTGWCAGKRNGKTVFVTNSHVVGTEKQVMLVQNGRPDNPTGTVVVNDTWMDLALIETDAEFPSLRVAETVPPQGTPVAVIGAPLGQTGTVTVGIVSSQVPRENLISQYTPEVFQVDAPINPGNSGGPIINEAGEVIGVVEEKFPNAEGMGFAIVPAAVISFLHAKGVV